MNINSKPQGQQAALTEAQEVAANAYPRLVAALRKCRELANAESTKGAQTVVLCDDLLAELGEAE